MLSGDREDSAVRRLLRSVFQKQNIFRRSKCSKTSSTIFSRTEKILWLSSAAGIVAAFAIFDRAQYLTLAASLIGVTSLIFNAKGNPVGQALMIVFSLLYGLISYTFAYLRRDDHLPRHDPAHGGGGPRGLAEAFPSRAIGPRSGSTASAGGRPF